jgi:hypothetical protein
VLAYIFWHRPHPDTAAEVYEQAQLAFHRSLAHSPPVGLCGSACLRAAQAPWLAGQDEAQTYEDWYLLEDFTALGVLGEAAVGRGHRSAHDGAARHLGAGTAGLYALAEGERARLGRPGPVLGQADVAVWVGRAAGAAVPAGSDAQGLLGDLLGDGADPRAVTLWRRQLVLGPAPEYCLLAGEVPAGVGAARLPAGWQARACAREPVWDGS